VPVQIFIALFAELVLYGFLLLEGSFAELRGILEKVAGRQRAAPPAGLAEPVRRAERCVRLFLGLFGLVLLEPAFEQGDSAAEAVVEQDQPVDAVEVSSSVSN
jgi:hypothetical protein